MCLIFYLICIFRISVGFECFKKYFFIIDGCGGGIAGSTASGTKLRGGFFCKEPEVVDGKGRVVGPAPFGVPCLAHLCNAAISYAITGFANGYCANSARSDARRNADDVDTWNSI